MKRRFFAVAVTLAVVASTACGPDANSKSDWIVGTFSDRDIEDRSLGLSAVGHFDFRDDGTLHVSGVSECEQNIELPVEKYEWTRDGEDLVVVEMPADTPFEEWRITRGEQCTRIQVDQIQDGEAKVSYALTRGEVCMKKLPPCPPGASCESCETIWCDGPPPPCD